MFLKCGSPTAAPVGLPPDGPSKLGWPIVPPKPLAASAAPGAELEVGTEVGLVVGVEVGAEVGLGVGLEVGLDVGEEVGLVVGLAVGLAVGVEVGFAVVGPGVGDGVGALWITWTFMHSYIVEPTPLECA